VSTSHDDNTTDGWRGRFDEHPDDLPIDESVPRRREARALLLTLLAPYRVVLAALAVVVIAENVARLAIPLLVKRGIDHAIPPLLAGGSAGELVMVVAALCGLVALQAVTRMVFLSASGRIGQRVLLDLLRLATLGAQSYGCTRGTAEISLRDCSGTGMPSRMSETYIVLPRT
jgi:hypothetical protein